MKGLSFSEPMVKAWMEGRKTVTRRIMKVPSDWELGYTHCFGQSIVDVHFYGPDDDRIVKPRYTPGEMVYIKETWAVHLCCGRNDENIHYKADKESCPIDGQSLKWKSPRFMPEWASRSHARIVSVRPERIGEITEEEAIKEGVRIDGTSSMGHVFTAREHFACLWESLHPGSWDQNPWVWVIELEKLP